MEYINRISLISLIQSIVSDTTVVLMPVALGMKRKQPTTSNKLVGILAYVIRYVVHTKPRQSMRYVCC